jgi:hypothetical protein
MVISSLPHLAKFSWWPITGHADDVSLFRPKSPIRRPHAPNGIEAMGGPEIFGELRLGLVRLLASQNCDGGDQCVFGIFAS